MNIAEIILSQIGGNKFTVMTGSKNYMFAEVTETNKEPWLRMDLAKNSSKCNRLKITLNGKDLYRLEFYTMRKTSAKKLIEDRNADMFTITNQTIIDDVYAEDLQNVFTNFTQLYTRFGQQLY